MKKFTTLKFCVLSFFFFITPIIYSQVGINTTDPQKDLHIAGSNGTMRIDGLNTTNNSNNIVDDPAPVYVDNNGDITLQPSLVQTFMPINVIDFLSTTTISSNGGGVTADLYTTSITLTQESLVHIVYQFSVAITRKNGDVIVDGASRLFRSGILVNSDPVHLGYSTGTYTNNPGGTSGTFASGYYYLHGSGYVQLAAGTHTIKLDVLGFGGDFDYKMWFGETNQDRFQVVVSR